MSIIWEWETQNKSYRVCQNHVERRDWYTCFVVEKENKYAEWIYLWCMRNKLKASWELC